MNNNIHNIQESIKRIPKKYFFLYGLLAIFFISSCFWYSYSKYRVSAKKNNAITQREIKIVAWDLHDVLFYGKPSMAKALWKYRKKIKLIPGGSVTKLILKDFKRIITGKERRLNSTMIIKKALKAGQKELAEFLITHEADCKPANDMLELIKKLNSLGYKQYVCSNISSYGFERLVQKYPEFFSYFTGMYTTLENNGVKPQERFFRSFLKTYNFPAQSVLFIDDKMKNCKGAQKLGINTYCFKGNHKKDRKNAINEIYHALGISNDNQSATKATLTQQGIS